MAVTHNVVNNGSVVGASVLSFGVTVVAGDDKAALIGIGHASENGATVQSVTFGGATAVFLQLVQDSVGTCEQYYAVGVVAGARTISISWDQNVSVAIAGCEVMNNVNQTTPLGSAKTNHGNTNNPTVTLVGTISGSLVVDTVLVDRNVIVTTTVDPSQTQRWTGSAGSVPARVTSAGSTKPSAGGSLTMQWSLSGSRVWDLCAAEFLFATPAPPAVGIGGYTSYTYGDDPTPLESLRPPEEMQRVWVNDRRYMQGRP
jgi:hypothetical protein